MEDGQHLKMMGQQEAISKAKAQAEQEARRTGNKFLEIVYWMRRRYNIEGRKDGNGNKDRWFYKWLRSRENRYTSIEDAAFKRHVLEEDFVAKGIFDKPREPGEPKKV